MPDDEPRARLTSGTVSFVSGSDVPLVAVDSVSVLTVCDNSIDIVLLDEGPAHRILGRGGVPRHFETDVMRDRVIDVPVAQHGFRLWSR